MVHMYCITTQCPCAPILPGSTGSKFFTPLQDNTTSWCPHHLPSTPGLLFTVLQNLPFCGVVDVPLPYQLIAPISQTIPHYQHICNPLWSYPHHPGHIIVERHITPWWPPPSNLFSPLHTSLPSPQCLLHQSDHLSVLCIFLIPCGYHPQVVTLDSTYSIYKPTNMDDNETTDSFFCIYMSYVPAHPLLLAVNPEKPPSIHLHCCQSHCMDMRSNICSYDNGYQEIELCGLQQ